MLLRSMAISLSLLIPSAVGAADFSAGPITLTIPPGFEGPVQTELGGVAIHVFTRENGRGFNASLTVVVGKVAVPSPKDANEGYLTGMRTAAAHNCLRGFADA